MIDQIESNDMALTPGSKMFLKETAGWTKFISIVGFVMLGLMVILSLFAGSLFGEAMEVSGMEMIGGAFLTVFYLGIAVLYFFPIYYLFQFSAKMKAALQEQSSDLLQLAFENLKSHYKFMGILLIIGLGFYAIALVIGGIAALSMM